VLNGTDIAHVRAPRGANARQDRWACLAGRHGARILPEDLVQGSPAQRGLRPLSKTGRTAVRLPYRRALRN